MKWKGSNFNTHLPAASASMSRVEGLFLSLRVTHFVFLLLLLLLGVFSVRWKDRRDEQRTKKEWDEMSGLLIQSAPSSSRNRDIKPKKKERNERKTQNRNKSERERERGNLNIYTLSINSDFLPRSSRYNSSSMWFSGGGFSVGPGETRAERREKDEYTAWEVTSVHESRKTHKHSKFRVIRAHMYRFNNTHTKMLLWRRLLAGDWMTFERSCLVVLLPLKQKHSHHAGQLEKCKTWNDPLHQSAAFFWT